MKIKPFIISSLLSAGAVLLFSKKESIITELTDTKNNIDKSKDSLSKIKQNLSLIQEQQPILKDVSDDLNYKLRVFNKDTQAHINEIKTILNKYQKTKIY